VGCKLTLSEGIAMIEPNIFGIGLEIDNLNTAEALGFTQETSTSENPYIIPDSDDNLEFLKKLRPIAIA
jgi:hypothetical protein